MVEQYLTRNDYAEGTAAKHFFFSSIVMLNIGVFLALGTSMRLAWPDVFPNDIPCCTSGAFVRCTSTSSSSAGSPWPSPGPCAT